eukprot:SAG11_NODE_21895_length_416_cov_1.321767_1_plen_26_part_10
MRLRRSTVFYTIFIRAHVIYIFYPGM